MIKISVSVFYKFIGLKVDQYPRPPAVWKNNRWYD